MRLIIEERLSDGDSDTVNDGDGVLAVVERRDCSLAQLGLTLGWPRCRPSWFRNRSGGSWARPIVGAAAQP
jgi:hypothetical protein